MKLESQAKPFFNFFAHNYTGATEQSPRDPAFDLENEVLINFSNNITSFLNGEVMNRIIQI